MLNFRKWLYTGALVLCIGGSASAQTANHVNLMPLLSASRSAAVVQVDPTSPLANVSLHGGAMITPRGGGMVGADIALPTLSLGYGWHGRLDADVIFKANFGGINDIIPVTLDQLYYSPNGVEGHNVYYGAGLGAVLSGPAKFDGKLILGTELTTRLGVEANVHFTENDTLVTIFARLHL